MNLTQIVCIVADLRRTAPFPHTGAPVFLRAASGGDSARARERIKLPPRQGGRPPRPQAGEHSVRSPRPSLPRQDMRL